MAEQPLSPNPPYAFPPTRPDHGDRSVNTNLSPHTRAGWRRTRLDVARSGLRRHEPAPTSPRTKIPAKLGTPLLSAVRKERGQSNARWALLRGEVCLPLPP